MVTQGIDMVPPRIDIGDLRIDIGDLRIDIGDPRIDIPRIDVGDWRIEILPPRIDVGDWRIENLPRIGGLRTFLSFPTACALGYTHTPVIVISLSAVLILVDERLTVTLATVYAGLVSPPVLAFPSRQSRTLLPESL